MIMSQVIIRLASFTSPKNLCSRDLKKKMKQKKTKKNKSKIITSIEFFYEQMLTHKISTLSLLCFVWQFLCCAYVKEPFIFAKKSKFDIRFFLFFISCCVNWHIYERISLSSGKTLSWTRTNAFVEWFFLLFLCLSISVRRTMQEFTCLVGISNENKIKLLVNEKFVCLTAFDLTWFNWRSRDFIFFEEEIFDNLTFVLFSFRIFSVFHSLTALNIVACVQRKNINILNEMKQRERKGKTVEAEVETIMKAGKKPNERK